MKKNDDRSELTYKDAGVDIVAGEALSKKAKSIAKKTRRKEVIGDIGGFGALFALPTGYEEPLLVSGTDGVGTKLRLALDLGIHNTIGIDLVAMCVNDLIVQGAKPLFFLDYIAVGKLDLKKIKSILKGIFKGCHLADCKLIGGETAEMPGVYSKNKFDLAGFSVGIVSKRKILNKYNVKDKDIVLAIPSSGFHSNGFSLVRSVLKKKKINKSFKKNLLKPTKIYSKEVLKLCNKNFRHK